MSRPESPRKKPRVRLLVAAALAPGAVVEATEAQAHYLLNVMRLKASDEVELFNGRDGAWRTVIAVPAKRRVSFTVTDLLRPQRGEPDVWLAFAPVKRLEYIGEKATELGARALLPVMTRHTDVTRVNLERFRANVVEAAEQCGRLSVPEVHPVRSFDAFLAAWPADRPLYYLDETGAGGAIAAALAGSRDGPCGFLVGPEGGFAESELDALRHLPSARGVSLGSRILRAETAALAALACWQALSGDWRAGVEGGLAHRPEKY